MKGAHAQLRAVLSPSDSRNNREAEYRERTVSKYTGKALVPETDGEFCRFWDCYPKHIAKQEARKAWAQLAPGPDLVDRIVAALAWQCQQPSWLKDGAAYVPNAATYLRGERWTDEQPCQACGLSPKTAGTLAAAAAILKGTG